MSKTLDLAYVGHPILRTKAHPVQQIDASVLELIEHMKATLHSYNALGLAAPQVGLQCALFLARFPEEAAPGAPPLSQPRVFINPRLEDPSPEMWEEEEGCLSIPKLFVPVRRPLAITITAQDEAGRLFTERLEGWPAKIVMHENDHLNGTLFIDRLSVGDKKKHAEGIARIKKERAARNRALRAPQLFLVPSSM